MPNFARTGPGRLILTACASLALTGASLSAATLAGATTAPAPMAHSTSKSAVVVKERTRAHFGKILVTVRGAALYYKPHGSCTGVCLSVWPRLVMPAGKTMPKGASCLGTSAFGRNHRLQVTYRKHRLYTFVSDMGTSVTGNNVEGFKVAKVVRCG
jgi:hypothetical protein